MLGIRPADPLAPAHRPQAAARWPKKLLTDASSQPVHVDCKRFNREACGGVDAAFRAAAAELLTFSKADYHVVTQDRCAVLRCAHNAMRRAVLCCAALITLL